MRRGALRQKRCGHLFGKLTASMADGASVASVDKTLRRMTDRMPAGDVDGKWRGPLQDALAKVNEKDLEAMREGMQDLELAYPVSVGLPPDNVHALFVLLKSMLAPAGEAMRGSSPVSAQVAEEPSASRSASTHAPEPIAKATSTPLSAQPSDVSATAEGAGPNPPQGLIPPPPPRLRRPPRNRRRRSRRPPRDRTRRPTNAAITMRWPMRSAIRSCARLRRLRARRARSPAIRTPCWTPSAIPS